MQPEMTRSLVGIRSLGLHNLDCYLGKMRKKYLLLAVLNGYYKVNFPLPTGEEKFP